MVTTMITPREVLMEQSLPLRNLCSSQADGNLLLIMSVIGKMIKRTFQPGHGTLEGCLKVIRLLVHFGSGTLGSTKAWGPSYRPGPWTLDPEIQGRVPYTL